MNGMGAGLSVHHLRNEYLAAENRILRAQLKDRLRLSDGERATLGEIGHKALEADQTVGNILARHGIPTAPDRKKTTGWADFIRAHKAVLAATDFFGVGLLTPRGLVTFYVLFFIQAGRYQATLSPTAEP